MKKAPHPFTLLELALICTCMWIIGWSLAVAVLLP